MNCKNCELEDEYCASGDCPTSQSPRNHLATKPQAIDLTEQWKKGKLPEGFYYIKCDWSDEVEIRYVHNGVDDWKAIFAEVPSYDEWKAAQEQLHKEGIWYTEISHKNAVICAFFLTESSITNNIQTIKPFRRYFIPLKHIHFD